MYFFKPEREEGVDLTSSHTESLNAQACAERRIEEEGLLFDNRGNVSFSLSFLPLFPGDCCVAAAPHVDEHANKASLQPRGEKGSEK